MKNIYYGTLSIKWHSNARGFSLLELIVVISIIAILIIANTSITTNQKHRQFAEQQFSLFQQALQSSRRFAIIKNHTITLCPIVNKRCVNQWNLGFKAFIDNNANLQLDSDDQIIDAWQVESSTGSNSHSQVLSWRNNNRYLRFNSSGFINAPGTLKYCIERGEEAYSGDLIVSRSGRIRKQWYRSNINCI